MITLALDPAASCGWAVADVEASGPVGVILWGTWNLTPNQGRKAGKTEHPGERLARLRILIQEICEDEGVERILYEDTSDIVRHKVARAAHGRYAGTIWLAAAELGIPVVPIRASVLKKAVAMAGNADKPDMVRAVQLRTNIDVGKEHDAADAIGLLYVESEG